MNPEIIFENDEILVINKPAGLIVHSDGRTKEKSVAEWVVQRYPGLAEVGEAWVSPQGETVPRPGVVHRLDRTTSGVMVIAKTQTAYEFLKEQFQNRSVKKTYQAFVYGHMKTDTGIIEAEIVRIRSTPPRWGVKRAGEKDKKHRHAITEWRVLMRGADPELNEAVSLLEVMPKTGRTHQIRVHLKAVNHPIVCDPLYATGKPCLLGFSRPALHARFITITLQPGKQKTFEASLPEDFLRAEKEMK